MTVDVRDTDEDGTSSQEVPLEGSRRRRLGLSVFIAVTLMAILVSVMPASALRNDLLTVARPYLLATGLDQNWGVFAPTPPRATSTVWARVDHADGSVAEYPFPDEDGISGYWNFRWRKYVDHVSSKRAKPEDREAIARWVVEQDRAAGGEPRKVTLLRQVVVNLPPGPGPDTGPSKTEPFYSVGVRPR